MAAELPGGERAAMPFSDFPEDVQLTILSFLSAADISAFSATSRRTRSLCRPDSRLWFALCHRRWGHLTRISAWSSVAGIGGGFRSLYKTLSKWDHLIGFWRSIGGRPLSPLLFFEWGPSFIAASRVAPGGGDYEVTKTPFLRMALSPGGEPVNFLYPDNKMDDLGVADCPDLVRVQVNFVGKNHLVVEEDLNYDRKLGCVKTEEDLGLAGSPPDAVMAEIYQYFANRTSPVGDRALRRQRRKEKGRLGRRRFEAEHYVKIVNCAPTPSRPLQGLWKGICESMNLDFYLVAYDDIGGITCRKVGVSSEPLFFYSPVFWTSNTTFIESPFSKEEEDIYESRVHIYPQITEHTQSVSSNPGKGGVSRILYINSSYDLVLPELTSSSSNPRQVEGRIWQYEDGTFGFGFLRNDFVIDLKHIVLNGHLLDAVEHSRVGTKT